MAWQKNGTPDTLTGAGDVLSIADLTAKKFNQFLVHTLNSGSIIQKLRHNNNSNTVYADRASLNGGGEATQINQTEIDLYNSNGTTDVFSVIDVISITGEEKLIISHTNNGNGAGAGNAPNRSETVAKFVPSPDADITRSDVINTGTGDYAVDSNLSALGTD